jgi:hypothetical protein
MTLSKGLSILQSCSRSLLELDTCMVCTQIVIWKILRKIYAFVSTYKTDFVRIYIKLRGAQLPHKKGQAKLGGKAISK